MCTLPVVLMPRPSCTHSQPGSILSVRHTVPPIHASHAAFLLPFSSGCAVVRGNQLPRAGSNSGVERSQCECCRKRTVGTGTVHPRCRGAGHENGAARMGGHQQTKRRGGAMSRVRGLVEELDPGRDPGLYCREHCGGYDPKGAGGFERQGHPRCAEGGVSRAREKISPLVGGSQCFPSLRGMWDERSWIYQLYCTYSVLYLEWDLHLDGGG